MRLGQQSPPVAGAPLPVSSRVCSAPSSWLVRASRVGPAAVGVTAHVSLALGALRPVGLTGHTASSVAAAPRGSEAALCARRP